MISTPQVEGFDEVYKRNYTVSANTPFISYMIKEMQRI